MARRRKKSDDVYNARRRYRRQAERYERKSRASKGIARTRYFELARNAIEKAIATYHKATDKITGAVRDIAQRLGVSIDDPSIKQRAKDVGSLVRESKDSLASAYTGDELRTREARALLKRGNIGSKFFAGTIEVWQDVPYEDREQAILDFFGKTNLMDVLEELEKVADIYRADEGAEYASANISTLSIVDYVAKKAKGL